MATWARLAGLGELDRGFVSVGGELLVFCARGPFAALAVADPTARPGVILTQLEQTLLAADEARVQGKEQLRSTVDAAEGLPSRGLRAPLHPERSVGPVAPASGTPARDDRPAPPVRPAVPANQPAGAAESQETARRTPPPEDDIQVDLVQLAREFGALYDRDDQGDDRR